MGFKRFLRRVGRIALGPAVAAVDIVQGKNPIKAILTAPIAGPVATAALAVNTVAALDAKLTALEAKVVGVFGEGARNFFLDAKRILQPVDSQTAAGLTDSLEKFSDTLDFGYLDPLVGLLATEIQRARDAFINHATPIPGDVIAKLPPDLAALAAETKVILVASANNLSLPAFAIEHLRKASAVTAIDLILFKTIPGSDSVDDLHYWSHELTHVDQYKKLSLSGFAKRYVHETIRGGLNELEKEADVSACEAFRVARPFYIDACPI